MHYTLFLGTRVANSSASKLQPAMVDISYRCQITYQEEKPVRDLVEEHQGQKFLKISATNYAICQLVCGGKLPTKNPSLAKSKELQTLVQARNDKIQELLAAPEEDTQEGQELFDSEMPANKGTKKRKAKAMEAAGDKCLVGGQRPTKCHGARTFERSHLPFGSWLPNCLCPTQQRLQDRKGRLKPQVTTAVVATKRQVAAKDCKSQCLA